MTIWFTDDLDNIMAAVETASADIADVLSGPEIAIYRRGFYAAIDSVRRALGLHPKRRNPPPAQQNLSNGQEKIEVSVQEQEMYRIVYVEGQGFAFLRPEDYRRIPSCWRGYVLTLAYCKEREFAELVAGFLPKGHVDGDRPPSRRNEGDLEKQVLKAVRENGWDLLNLLNATTEAGQRLVS